MFKKYTNEEKEVEERSKKYKCDGLCYGPDGMCPAVETCEATRTREFLGTIFAIGCFVVLPVILFLYFCLK